MSAWTVEPESSTNEIPGASVAFPTSSSAAALTVVDADRHHDEHVVGVVPWFDDSTAGPSVGAAGLSIGSSEDRAAGGPGRTVFE